MISSLERETEKERGKKSIQLSNFGGCARLSDEKRIENDPIERKNESIIAKGYSLKTPTTKTTTTVDGMEKEREKETEKEKIENTQELRL